MDAFIGHAIDVIRTEQGEGREIEFRIGKMNRGSFDTNVTKETYDKVLRRLHKYTGWECVSTSDTSKYYYDGGRRVTYDHVVDDVTECVIKKRVRVDDILFENQRFDVRLGVSSEVPCDHVEDEAYTKERRMKRVSFLRKDLRIDVTIVSGDPDDPDSENETEYQIELELLRIPEPHYELYNMVYKVFDVLAITV
jgi:hypothetical protein